KLLGRSLSRSGLSGNWSPALPRQSKFFSTSTWPRGTRLNISPARILANLFSYAMHLTDHFLQRVASHDDLIVVCFFDLIFQFLCPRPYPGSRRNGAVCKCIPGCSGVAHA